MSNSSAHDKKAKLRAWKENQRSDALAAFPLPDSTLAEFFSRLEVLCGERGCGHTHQSAQDVASEMSLSSQQITSLLSWCGEHGGYCDCEILANTLEHWEEFRDAI